MVDLLSPFGGTHYQQDANPLCQALLRAEHKINASGSEHANPQPQLSSLCSSFTICSAHSQVLKEKLRLRAHQPQLNGDGNSKEISMCVPGNQVSFMTKNHPNSLPNITVLLSESHQIHSLSFRAEKKVIMEKNEQDRSFYLSWKHLRIYVQKESAGHMTVSRAEWLT